MTPVADAKTISDKLCQFARANFLADGVEFNEHSPLADAGIDSFALVELLLCSESMFGIRVPESHLTRRNLVSVASLAGCIAELATAKSAAPSAPLDAPAPIPEPASVQREPPPAAEAPTAIAELPRQTRVAPGDCFMNGQDRWMRRLGLPGNICHAVLRLEAGLDVELLRRRVAESPILNWLGRARMVRPFQVLPPVWRASTASQPILREHEENGLMDDRPTVLPDYIPGNDLRPGRDPSLALNLVRHADGSSHLIFSWNHTLLDARGTDLVLRHLNGGSATNGAPASEYLVEPKAENWTPAAWWRNAKNAHRCVEWLEASGREPLFSLLPARRPEGPCRQHYRIISFSAAEAARIEARFAQVNAGIGRGHFYLAASVRALHGIAVGRGNRDGAYLVPVPHDTRRKGGNGPILSNNLSMLFYRVEPQLAGSFGSILSELALQMTAQIRTRFPESCMAALDMFKPLPLNSFVRHLAKPTRGKFASLSFSDSGEVCAGMTGFLGARIREVTHLVPAWRPPGLTVVFLSFGGKPSVQMAWVDDCISQAEVESFERGLLRALLEEAVL